MEPAPELQQLAKLMPGEPRAALRRLLLLLCEQLGMDTAYVCSLWEDQPEVRLAVHADGSSIEGADGLLASLAQTWGGVVVEDDVLMVADARDHRELLAPLATQGFTVAAYARVALRGVDGHLLGTLCAFRHEPHPDLNTRDRDVLCGLARVVASHLEALERPVEPRQRQADLASIADTVVRAQDVEQLSRPLLEALHELTGLASTYLTVVHDDEGVQELRYTRNAREDFVLPEGLVVPWADTLCKRALDEGRTCTTDVPGVWGDSTAAQALGIQTYVSVPITLADGRVWGTLCGADAVVRAGAEEHLPTLRLFARLIASEVERAAALDRERALAARARREAETDALTGCADRRVVEPWLTRTFQELEAEESIGVVFVDIDAFKQVNDRFGHPAGDAVLIEVGRRLRVAARPGDLVARMGGDEFLVAARLRPHLLAGLAGRLRDGLTFPLAWGKDTVDVRCSVGAAAADTGGADALMTAADAAMYADKRATYRRGSADAHVVSS